jgi:hypothetical protein
LVAAACITAAFSQFADFLIAAIVDQGALPHGYARQRELESMLQWVINWPVRFGIASMLMLAALLQLGLHRINLAISHWSLKRRPIVGYR